MNPGAWVLAGWVAANAVGAESVTAPSPAALLAEIESTGARAVLHRLWTDQPQFDAVCSSIESGKAEWLEAARRLRSASDAHLSESLDYSVARGLRVAPVRVLGLVGRGFTLEGTCTSPFIEPEPGVAERYERQALEALRSLKSSSLAPVAEQCAQRVRLPPR